MKNKTVYILGAGFSFEAGAPTQSKIVEKIFEIHRNEPSVFGGDKIKKFEEFLSHTLYISPDEYYKIPLEDIFTPLDRCLIDNISFRNLNIYQVKEIRELIYYLIGRTLQHLLTTLNKDYINKFADFLVKESEKRKNYNYSNIDPVSVITTNWDIILDNSIKDCLYAHNNGVVDYCCHISSFDKDDNTVKPGLEMLGMGGFNVKLLKLHESLNWLQCPRCHRVYVDFYNKIAIDQYINPQNCRHCDNNFGVMNSHELTSNLIMPTFLKNFSNPQYKLIWQNAAIELAEANKIVFIGYSLPQADFEMRQLLSRMIRTNAKIEVVSSGHGTAEYIKGFKERYKVFFGNRKIDFFLNGAKDYIDMNLN